MGMGIGGNENKDRGSGNSIPIPCTPLVASKFNEETGIAWYLCGLMGVCAVIQQYFEC